MGYASRAAYPLVAITTTALVVVLDLMTKTRWFGYEPRWTKLSPLLQTIDHHNYGLLFDLPAPTWLIVGASLAVLVAVLMSYGRRMVAEPRIALAVGLLVGGAAGNGYDRVIFGFVRDWILLLERSAFNIADVAIGLGIVLLAWEHYRVDEKNEAD